MIYRRPDVGLIRAVLAAPDDPLPRLVLADWYREHLDDQTADALMAGKWMPVDDLTAAACSALVKCEIPSGFAVRFVENVCRPIADGQREREPATEAPRETNVGLFSMRATAHRVTPKQLLWIWRLVWSHRGRLEDKALPLRAAELLNGIVEDVRP